MGCFVTEVSGDSAALQIQILYICYAVLLVFETGKLIQSWNDSSKGSHWIQIQAILLLTLLKVNSCQLPCSIDYQPLSAFFFFH
jgi:hypothetical protein